MLTETEVRNAKPKETGYKLSDQKQLYLFVSPAGGKSWRMDARIDDKRVTLSLGRYPDISLKQARQAALHARELIAAGIDPREERKAVKLAAIAEKQRKELTFEKVALAWHAEKTTGNTPGYRKQILSRISKLLLPFIGTIPISELEPTDIVQAVKHTERRGAIEQAHRLLQLVGQICRYARAAGYVKYNVADGLTEALAPIPKDKPRAALTDPADVSRLLQAIEGYQGYGVTKSALKILPYVFVRSQELRGARWEEFDLDKGLWTIPARRMKMKTAHIVPLAHQVVALIRELEPWTGTGEYLFPSPQAKNKSLSDMGLLNALRRMGYTGSEMSIHGFRAIASTFLNESGAYRPEIIEVQLAHMERNRVKAAYNRADYLEERSAMMQNYADYLDSLRAGNIQTMKEWKERSK